MPRALVEGEKTYRGGFSITTEEKDRFIECLDGRPMSMMVRNLIMSHIEKCEAVQVQASAQAAKDQV